MACDGCEANQMWRVHVWCVRLAGCQVLEGGQVQGEVVQGEVVQGEVVRRVLCGWAGV